MTKTPRLPAIDPQAVELREGSRYPGALAEPCAKRLKRAMGDAAGLTHFGVNLVWLPPGAWSSQRHWHANEDEFIYVLEGKLTLITEDGEQTLGPGAAAGFPAGLADGHHLVNKTGRNAVYLEVGDRAAEEHVTYPDVDMRMDRTKAGRVVAHKNGKPYR